MTMQRFFVFCGEIVETWTTEEGETPRKHFTQHWLYERGFASFDGAKWEFTLAD